MRRFASCLGKASLLAFGLAGCANPAEYLARRPDAAIESLEALAQGPISSPAGSTVISVSLPAAAGRVAAFETRTTAGSTRQETRLEPGRGEKASNGMILVLGRLATFPEKPTESGIKAELSANFAGQIMQVAGKPRYNAFGPYGLAVGRSSAGLRCLYAWQWLEKIPHSSEPVAASLRVRLCRSDLTLDQMAAFVDQLDLQPGASIASNRRPEKSFAHGLVTRKANAQAKNSTEGARIAVDPPRIEEQSAVLDQSLPPEAYDGPKGGSFGNGGGLSPSISPNGVQQ